MKQTENIKLIQELIKKSAKEEKLTKDSKPITQIRDALEPIELLMDKFIVLQRAFQQIPDVEVPLKLKKSIAALVYEERYAKRLDFIYKPSLLTPNPLKSPEMGRISREQYEHILKNAGSLYQAELIFLTLGLLANEPLEEKLTRSFEVEVVNIGRNFLVGNYYQCWQLILDLAAQPMYGFNIEVVSLIKEQHVMDCKNEKENEVLSKNEFEDEDEYKDKKEEKDLPDKDLNKTQARRFFESELARLFFNEAGPRKSIERIAREMYGKIITDNEDLEDFLGFFPYQEFLRKELLGHSQFIEQIVDSIIRTLNFPQVTRRKVKDELGDQPVYSGNPGIMKSFSHMYTNETTEKPRYYAKADIITYVHEEVRKLSQTIFVTGVSGHIHWAVAIMVLYSALTDKQFSLEKLSQVVNDFLMGCIALNIKRGYHSFWENYYVFAEQSVRREFLRYGVDLDLLFSPRTMLTAIRRSQEYTKSYCLRFCVATEIDKNIDLVMEASKGSAEISDDHDEEGQYSSEKNQDTDPGWAEETELFQEHKNTQLDKESKSRQPFSSDVDNQARQKNQKRVFDFFKEKRLKVNLTNIDLGNQKNELYHQLIKLQKDLVWILGVWDGHNAGKDHKKDLIEMAEEIKLGKQQLATRTKSCGYQCHDVPPDGNCFFSAMVHQLSELKLTEKDETLRELVAFYISEHKEVYQPFFTTYESISVYAQKLVMERTWADAYAIEAMARVKSVTIVIIPKEEKKPVTIFKPAQSKSVVMLGYEGNHYQSLLAIEESKLQPGEKLAKIELHRKIAEAETLPEIFGEKIKDKAQKSAETTTIPPCPSGSGIVLS